MSAEQNEVASPFPEVRAPSGFPNIDLVHVRWEWLAEDGFATDGSWSVTLADRNIAMQRCYIGFRTLHAAMHYAQRIGPLADWTADHKALLSGDAGQELAKAMRHAEAHAHEVDAVWPMGAWIPFENGPSICDDDGTTRSFMAQAPSIDWTKDEDGFHRCSECGADPVVRFEWMDAR